MQLPRDLEPRVVGLAYPRIRCVAYVANAEAAVEVGITVPRRSGAVVVNYYVDLLRAFSHAFRERDEGLRFLHPPLIEDHNGEHIVEESGCHFMSKGVREWRIEGRRGRCDLMAWMILGHNSVRMPRFRMSRSRENITDGRRALFLESILDQRPDRRQAVLPVDFLSLLKATACIRDRHLANIRTAF